MGCPTSSLRGPLNHYVGEISCDRRHPSLQDSSQGSPKTAPRQPSSSTSPVVRQRSFNVQHSQSAVQRINLGTSRSQLFGLVVKYPSLFKSALKHGRWVSQRLACSILTIRFPGDTQFSGTTSANLVVLGNPPGY